MLRTSVTKFKRVCTLAHVPRILRGDVWCPAGNFEKLSAILMTKYKSTTSGSNDDDDEKCKKCKHLIELAFGPDKLDAAERIENIDVRKVDELESMVSPDIEKVLCEKGKDIESEKNKELAAPIVEVDSPQEDVKCEKCKQLIDLVFGPDKPENQVESNTSKLPELETENVAQMLTPAFTKSETVNNKRIIITNEGLSNQEIDSNQANLQNVLNVTKTEDEEKLIQKIEKIEESPLVEADIDRKRHFMYNYKHDGNKGRHSVTMFEEIAKRCINSNDDKIDSKILEEMKRLGISQPLLEDLPTKNTQKPDLKSKEPPRDENNNTKMGRRNIGYRRGMKHLALRMGSDNISDVTDKMSKKDLPSMTPILERNSRAEREILIDRKKSPNLTEEKIEKLNIERTQLEHQSVIKSSDDCIDSPTVLNIEKETKNKADQREIEKLNIERTQLEHQSVIKSSDDCIDSPTVLNIEKETKNKADQREIEKLNIERTQLEHQSVIKTSNDYIDSSAVLNIEKETKNKADQSEIEKLNTERTQFQHQSVIKSSEDYNDSPAVLNIEKKTVNKDIKNESIVTSIENVSKADVKEPAVLFKEKEDPDAFRITPNTPKVETLTNRLSTLNNQVQQSTLISGSPQHVLLEKRDIEQTSFTKSDSSKLNKEIEKIFSDERIPRHLFAGLTVISKSLPSDTEFGKSLKAFYDQDSNEDIPLVKPDRLQYYSHNDEILEFRDCTQEVDPHVVIREYEDYDSEPTDTYPTDTDPTDTDPPYNNYSGYNYYNNQRNMYDQRNMYQNNMPSDNSGMYKNMTHYNRIMTNTSSSGYNMWDSITTGNNNVSSENSNFTDKYGTNKPSSNNYNEVLFDPYGKNMKADEWEEFEELEDSYQNSPNTNEKNNYSDVPVDPLLASHFAVNDGTLVSGNESSFDDDKGLKDNTMNQQKREDNTMKRESAQTMYPWIDKGTVASNTVTCNAHLEAQEPVETCITSEIQKEENMSLTEMLRKVREKARLEAYKQEVLIAAPVTEVDTTEGACKKPKPPCPPPQKTCPPSPPKCPPSNCPEPQPPCPKPCKPACPDPCSTPKCPPAEKKDPCAKFVNQKTVDFLGLVVTLGTLSPHTAAPRKRSIQSLENDNDVPSFVEDLLLRLYAINDGAVMPKIKKRLLENNRENYLPDVLLDRSFYFPKDYEPWTPIPSWPIPPKRVKNKLVCPKDGCRVPGPPAPGSPCKNIHHPCAGFPNDKKRT